MASAVFYRDQNKPMLTVKSGDGVYLNTTCGRRLLDASASAGVVGIGHGVREVSEAITQVSSEITFVYGGAFTHPWQEQLATRLIELAPGNLSSAYFTSGGSEANETAWKLARQYHLEKGNSSKFKAISRRQSYHGVTLAALSLSQRPTWSNPYAPLLQDVAHFTQANCSKCPIGRNHETCGSACLDNLEATILEEGPETVACVFVEPVPGPSLPGVIVPPNYFARIREICDKYDVLFIADEVLCGYGRTGKPFAIQHWDVAPDMLTMGKAIASGYASLAATLVSENIRDAIRNGTGRFVHGLTYSGNPFSCFTGLKVNELMHRDGLFERPAGAGQYLRLRLNELKSRLPIISEVRGLGLLTAVTFAADVCANGKRACTDITATIVQGMLDRNVVVIPRIPKAGDDLSEPAIQISPPFTINDSEINRIVETLEEVLSHM